MILRIIMKKSLPSMCQIVLAFALSVIIEPKILGSVSGGSSDANAGKKVYRTIQVQIVHRHGDRSPITPLRDEEFWAKQLVPKGLLEKIAENTEIIEAETENTHKAGGRGPFGKLTELGLLQMIKVGSTLREQFSSDEENLSVKDADGAEYYPYVWNPDQPLAPSNLRVFSTNFARTIQSVQGLLVGMFPDGTEQKIAIDARNTDWLIPDPQPRRSREQELLEGQLASRNHLKMKEQSMRPLAQKVTEVLHSMLADDAREASYGVAESYAGETSIEIEPLGWNQLAEITKCLAVRNMLPDGISVADQELISKHAAWRWFENLKVPRLAYLSMNKFVSTQLQFFNNHGMEPPVTIWSAHDSTLIGLLCAYRLEMPSVWPEYASYLILELLEVQEEDSKELMVRFSLNGERLRSMWNDDEPISMIPLSLLVMKTKTEGAATTKGR